MEFSNWHPTRQGIDSGANFIQISFLIFKLKIRIYYFVPGIVRYYFSGEIIDPVLSCHVCFHLCDGCCCFITMLTIEECVIVCCPGTGAICHRNICICDVSAHFILFIPYLLLLASTCHYNWPTGAKTWGTDFGSAKKNSIIFFLSQQIILV